MGGALFVSTSSTFVSSQDGGHHPHMLPGRQEDRGTRKRDILNPKAKSLRGQEAVEFWTHTRGDRPLLLLQGEDGTRVPWCRAWGQGSILSVASTSDKIGRASPGPATGSLPPRKVS